MRIARFVVAALVLALLAGLAAPVPAVEVGQKAPDFTLTGPGNKPVKLSELTVKAPVVVQTNALDLLNPDEVLKALKDANVS